MVSTSFRKENVSSLWKYGNKFSPQTFSQCL